VIGADRAPRCIVVVGGGVAAERCVHGLRERGYDGRIVMVMREPNLPYDRTLVSKDLLGPDGPSVRCELQEPDGFERLRVDVHRATAARRLDVPTRRVWLSHGGSVRYDRLIICTGGEPVVPAPLAHPAALALRELRDAEALRAALDRGGPIAIVGGGFIGGEVASAAVARGLPVTLIEALEQPLARVVGAEVGARVAALHRAAGVEVMTGAPATEIRRSNGALEVTLRGGEAVRAAAVLVGAGMRPATRWLADSPVRVDDGIVTDSACRTEVPDVLAAGDCARWHNPRFGGLMRVEHWDTARRHGAAVAGAALGDDTPFAPLPFFWSDQHGVKLQWVGYAASWDEVEIDDGDEPGFLARYRRGGRLVAVFAAGRPRAIAAARRELLTETTEVGQA
jgi:3-phenylpropionate/trans-cinnamate dioxygenase ferredoxin reductase component